MRTMTARRTAPFASALLAPVLALAAAGAARAQSPQLAVIAVGATGLLMLTGRIDWRRGAVVILGCFIVFGAASIVAGIRSVAGGV